MYLGSHPEIASLGEINMLGKALRMDRPCSCGELVRDCPAWAKVFDHYKQHEGLDLLDDPYALKLWEARAKFFIDAAHQTPAFERRFRAKVLWMRARRALPSVWGDRLPLPPGYAQMLDNKMALYAAVSKQWNRKVIVDSSKNAMEAIELARRWPSRVKVVLLFRDGRGVYLSHRTTGFERDESLQSWQSYYRRYAPLVRRFVPKECLITLRYEAFAAEPERVGRDICGQLGLQYHDAMPRLNGGDWHMVDGNRTRLFPGRGLRLDERWKAELAGDELAFFEGRAGALNRELGYA